MKELKKNKKKIIKISVIIIILVMIISMVIFYEKNENVRKLFDKYVFMKNVYENDLPIIKTNSQNVFVYKNNILIFEDNKLKFYNKYGKEEYSLNIELINPIFEANGDYICLAEKEGEKVYVISQRNIIWQENLEGNISKISINKNGECAITLFGTTDKFIIRVFNNKGEELFAKHIAEDYVIDTSISENNQHLAIAKINYEGIDIKSIIEIIEIKEAKEGKTVINEYKEELGDLITNISYNKKNTLICMYDNHISYIKDNKITKKVDFNSEEILFADVEDKIVKIVRTDGNIELQILDADTDKIVKYAIEEPKEIYFNDKTIAINFGSEAWFINESGWLMKEYKSSQEINKIVLNNNIAGIVYKDKIEIISL